jgi:aspartyl-tRNA(Asn)/glutamyl-tRNA(Gln) amidotransferase subunit C
VGTSSHDLPISTARRVAHLARLALTDAELEQHRSALSAVLGYVETLRELDLDGVEPLAHPSDSTNRLDADDPRPGLPSDGLMKMAPASAPPFVVVPKVIDADSGA